MNDIHFMQEALAEAEKALEKGEVPIGAVVVQNNRIIGRGFNANIMLNDPTAHAEIMSLREASKKINNFRLSGCDLYVTLEPCFMCAGALIQARIRCLIFGANDPKGGGIYSVFRFPFDKANHQPEIRSGILSRECGTILKNFFQKKR